jgi:hypothetical protein
LHCEVRLLKIGHVNVYRGEAPLLAGSCRDGPCTSLAIRTCLFSHTMIFDSFIPNEQRLSPGWQAAWSRYDYHSTMCASWPLAWAAVTMSTWPGNMKRALPDFPQGWRQNRLGSHLRRVSLRDLEFSSRRISAQPSMKTRGIT